MVKSILNLCSYPQALLPAQNIFIFFFHLSLSQSLINPNQFKLNRFFLLNFPKMKKHSYDCFRSYCRRYQFELIILLFLSICSMQVVIQYWFEYPQMFFQYFLIIFYNNQHFFLKFSQFRRPLFFLIESTIKLRLVNDYVNSYLTQQFCYGDYT